jgi:hypothetical protein
VQKAARVAAERGARWLHVDYEPQLAPFYRALGPGASLATFLNVAREPGHLQDAAPAAFVGSRYRVGF